MPSPYYNIPDPTYNRCRQIMKNAQAAWAELVIVVAAENIALGITQSGKTKLIADAMFPVMAYGSTGSLWEAYNELSKIKVTPEMAPFVTAPRIEWMKNKLIESISIL